MNSVAIKRNVFGKSVDKGWGMFVTFLTYKAKCTGKHFIKRSTHRRFRSCIKKNRTIILLWFIKYKLLSTMKQIPFNGHHDIS